MKKKDVNGIETAFVCKGWQMEEFVLDNVTEDKSSEKLEGCEQS